MTVTIPPFSPVGSAEAPPSKSMAHRLLLCAGLADGETLIRGVAPSEDLSATLDCLRMLGADCVQERDEVRVTGGVLRCRQGRTVLNCRESGTTLRFFLPLCLSGAAVTLRGSRRLLERPLDVYRDLCRTQNLRFEKNTDSVTVQGRLSPGQFELPGDVSSQFVSGLLFALPLLDGDSIIRLHPPVESRSYMDMTMDALRSFGVKARWMDRKTIAVPGGQRFRSPGELGVEGDWSNAAFFLALGVPVTGLRSDSLQGDRVCGDCFRALADGPAVIDLSDCPDLGPVLMAHAAMHRGGSFTGTRRLCLKESDRGTVMREELGKFGVAVGLGENRINVGCGLHAPSEALDGHNDHRVVMALSVLCSRVGGSICGAEAVRKSFPDFFERMEQLGAELTIQK